MIDASARDGRRSCRTQRGATALREKVPAALRWPVAQDVCPYTARVVQVSEVLANVHAARCNRSIWRSHTIIRFQLVGMRDARPFPTEAAMDVHFEIPEEFVRHLVFLDLTLEDVQRDTEAALASSRCRFSSPTALP